jgi:hypothetical protein
MRKFTIFQLEIRRLSITDIVFIVAYFVVTIVYFIWGYYDSRQKILGDIYISFLIFYLIILTPFGIRFRSVYFSSLWLTISVFNLHITSTLSLAPILLFILYHLIRWNFWQRYEREFIPLYVGRNFKMDRYISKIEHQGGTINDRQYMKDLIWLGVVILMGCFFGMFGKQF